MTGEDKGEKQNLAELVKQIQTLTAERDTLKADFEEAQGKITALEENETRLNRIVANTVLSSEPADEKGEVESKDFGQMYKEAIMELSKE